MAEDKIDSLIDFGPIQKEIDKLDGIVAQLGKKLKEFPAVKVYIEGAGNLKEYSVANQKMQQEVKAVINLVNQRFAADAKVITLQTDYARATAASRVEIQKQNAELKAQAQLQAANTGSIEKAKAQVALLSKERDRLNLFTEEGQQKQAKLNEQIDKYNVFIKKSVDSQAQQKINVGNYQGSAKLIVDALEKERKKLEELEKTKIRVQNAGAAPITGFGGNRSSENIQGSAGGGVSPQFTQNTAAATAEIKRIDAEIAKSRTIVEGFSRVTAQPNFLNVAAKVGDANAELKFFTKSLIDLERQGLGSSDAAKELRGSLAELTDQISDAKADIKALSSDTRGLDLFAGSISFAADAFQTFAGAAVLAGASEEDAAEATKTLVAVQSVANGVKGIANELTTRGTAANKLYTFAQNQVSIAMDGSAAASARLRAALITIGIGALIVGIGLLIANFSKIKEALGFTNKAQEAYNSTLKDFKEAAGEAIDKTNKVKLAFDQARKGVISKKDALRIYNDTLGDTLGAAKSLEEAEKLYADKADLYIKVTGLKAQANALFALSAQAAAKGITATNEDLVTEFDKFKQSLRGESFFKGVTKAQLAKIQKENAAAVIKQSAADQKSLFDAGAKLATEAEIIAKGANITIDQDKFKAEEDEAKKRIEARKKANEEARRIEADNNRALFQIEKDATDERARLAEKDVNNEELPLRERLNRLIDFNNEKQSILIAQKDFDLANEKLTSQQKLAITSKFGIESGKQLEEYEALHLSILKSAKKKEYDEYVKVVDDFAALNNKQFETKQFNGMENRNAELLQAAKDYRDGKIKTTEELNRKEKEINDLYDRIDLNQEIAHQTQLLLIKKAAGVGVEDELKALRDLRLRYDALEIQDAKEKGDKLQNGQDKKAATDLAFAEAKRELAKQTEDALFFFFDARLQKETNAQNERQRLLNEDTAKRITEINLLGLTDAERVRQIAIVEKKAAFQNEQIEKRKREIAIQRARFERTEAISDIIQNTAQAVTAALPNIPLAILVGALGGIQLTKAIATPIPKYKHGRGATGKEEIAITGDGGKPEYIVRGDGSVDITPARPTLTHLMPKDIVHKDMESFVKSHLPNLSAIIQSRTVAQPKFEDDLKLKSLNRIEKAIRDTKHQTFIRNEHGIESSEWFAKMIRK